MVFCEKRCYYVAHMKIIEFEEKENKPFDILIRQVGYESCLPSHHFGPFLRQHYLIHYIKKGKGIFRYGDKEIELNEGEMFLIYPDEVTYYEADENNPWDYYWFGFEGECCEELISEMGFSKSLRRVKYTLDALFSIDEVVKDLSERRVLSISDRIYETAKFYEIFSWIIRSHENKGKEEIKKPAASLLAAAAEYIKRSYMLDLTIEDIASHIGVDRTQLYRYFMKGFGKSPKQYLIDIRMKEAQKLLKNTNLKVKQIAYSVGYQDEYLFSKMFKRIYLLSPKNYRLKAR